MKKILIAIILIIIVIAGIILVKINMNDKYDYEIEVISEYNYFIYRNNQKYGVIDKDGNTVIEANYTKVIIPNPQRDLFFCYDGDTAKVFNLEGQELFTEYESVAPIKLKNVASALAYEKSTLMYQKDGLYGIMNFEGEEITKNIYNSIENLQPTEGKFLVSIDSKYGVIDLKGNTLVDAEYDVITSDGYYTESDSYKKSGFIVANKTDDGYKYGYISYNAKNILENQYNEIQRVTKEDDKNIYLIVSENGQFGLYNRSKKIIENEYQDISYDDNIDLLMLQKNKQYGIATFDGDVIIPVENDKIESKGIYIYAEKSNDKKVYDTQGNEVNINYNRSIYKTENEDYMISTILNNNIIYYGITDKNGNQLVNEEYRYIEYLYKNYFIATDENGNLGVINSDGKIIVDMKYSSLQKIKDKNMIQAMDAETGMTEIYSQDMQIATQTQDNNIQIQDDYIIVSDSEKETYLDNNGTIIQDTSSLKKTGFPETIGEYKKEQITIENVYYEKE